MSNRLMIQFKSLPQLLMLLLLYEGWRVLQPLIIHSIESISFSLKFSQHRSMSNRTDEATFLQSILILINNIEHISQSDLNLKSKLKYYLPPPHPPRVFWCRLPGIPSWLESLTPGNKLISAGKLASLINTASTPASTSNKTDGNKMVFYTSHFIVL